MPIPEKFPEETDSTFIGRCMSDDNMLREYPEAMQRYAVCRAQLDNSKDWYKQLLTMFKKGESGNPNGRPKGTVSERLKMWEALGEYVVTQGAERAMAALHAMDDEEFLKNYLTMLEYFKPKQARVTHAGDESSPVIIQIPENL